MEFRMRTDQCRRLFTATSSKLRAFVVGSCLLVSMDNKPFYRLAIIVLSPPF